jgi:hypothetical protein
VVLLIISLNVTRLRRVNLPNGRQVSFRMTAKLTWDFSPTYRQTGLQNDITKIVIFEIRLINTCFKNYLIKWRRNSKRISPPLLILVIFYASQAVGLLLAIIIVVFVGKNQNPF